MKRLVLAGLCLLASGCKPVVAPSPLVLDAVALVARAVAEPAPGPTYGSFSALLRLPGQSVSLQGTLLVSAPDRFRVELRGPIGPAQVIVTCNGQDATLWLTPKNTFSSIPDANAILGGLVGAGEGVGGSAVAASLLLGRLPALPGAPVLRAAGSVATSTWVRDDGAIFEAGIEGGTGHLVSARALDASGLLLMNASWEAGPFPSAMRVELPTLGVVADLRFSSWGAATPADTLFEGAPPEGAVLKVLDLAALQSAP